MKMTIEKDRLTREKEHGKKISSHAEDVWGWTSPAGKIRADRRARYFIELGNYPVKNQILEIGCGTGLFTEKVHASTKAKITSIDISQELINQAMLKLPDVQFQVEDAMNLSFRSETFDAVFGSSILHHLDMKRSLQEIYRVLKPGGNLVFAEPNMLNPQIFIQKNIPFIKKWLGDSPDETAVVRWKMNDLLTETGFKNPKVFPYDFLHPSTPIFMIYGVQTIGMLIEKIPILKEIAGSVIIYAEK